MRNIKSWILLFAGIFITSAGIGGLILTIPRWILVAFIYSILAVFGIFIFKIAKENLL
jgi:hypothetical protein